MVLCFDIGNTKTACALYDGNVLGGVIEYPTCEVVTAGLLREKITQEMSQNTLKIDGMAFSSVVTQKNKEYMDFADNLNLNRIVKISPNCKLNVPLFYDLNTLGSDRIADIEEAHAEYGANVVVVDIGTAITFDVVKDGTFIGGVILPGLNSAFESLNKDTDAIKNVKFDVPADILGNNTADCIKSGIYFGWIAMIEGLFRKVKVLHDKDFTLVLTGGCSQILSPHISIPHIVNKMLTLNGIYRIYRNNC